MSKFNIKWEKYEDDERTILVRLQGAMDISIAEQMNHVFDEIIATERYFLILDMDEVSFVGSPAVGILMGWRRKLIEKQGNIALVGLSLELREKLNLMGANRIFRYYYDIQTVLTDFYWEKDSLMQNVGLRLPSNHAYVPALRRLISSVVTQKGFGRKDAFRIETIVDELTNNAIEHGNPKQEKVSVDFNMDYSKVEIIVSNMSRDVDSNDITTIKDKFNNPVVDEDSTRGRGLSLVKMLSDNLKLDINDQGTTVYVTKVREV
ncbi:MAG: STAS domain-containing protein [Fibrobacter sp.]|nr:STAS domain-containing protein [Fibrobacter sp.]